MVIDITAIVVAAIAAFPASILALSQWEKAKRDTEVYEALEVLSVKLQQHADDDAAFQEWIVGKLEAPDGATSNGER